MQRLVAMPIWIHGASCIYVDFLAVSSANNFSTRITLFGIPYSVASEVHIAKRNIIEYLYLITYYNAMRTSH